MPKSVARGPESYEKEKLLLAKVPAILEHWGFSAINVTKSGQMKFIDARTVNGSTVRFWFKQAWSDVERYSAVQFAQLHAAAAVNLPDSAYIDVVQERTSNAKKKGATYVLFVHMFDGRILDYVALAIDDVITAYLRQISQWPKRARNGVSPTLYFRDLRSVPDAKCVTAVVDFELPLSAVAGLEPSVKGQVPAVRKVTAEVELRLQQAIFRLRVGDRCGWKCVISGTALVEVLDAAHLPGKNWRLDNEAKDGIMLRSDLHRLLDRQLAEVRDGKFWIAPGARHGEYQHFHNRVIAI